MRKNISSLSTAIDIPAWLEDDRDTPWSERMQREHEIYQHLVGVDDRPLQRVMGWWQHIHSSQKTTLPGKKISTLFKRVAWLVTIAGFLIGLAISSALLYYDGSQPINVLVLLIVLVIAPLLLFLLSLSLPFWRSDSLMGEINIGSIILAIFEKKNPAWQSFFSSSRADTAKDKLLRWKFLVFSQQLGIGIAIAALIVLLAKVSFTDLAFGWSTTLELNTSRLTPWLQGLAWPWSAWLNQAVPSNELIEQSRFFRLQDSERMLSAQVLTAWWKYIAMCLLCYGVSLRLLTLWFANYRYHKAVEAMLLQHSEVVALLDRLEQNEDSRKAKAPVIIPSSDKPKTIANQNALKADLVIFWNGARLNDVPIKSEKIVEADSKRSLQLHEQLQKFIKHSKYKRIHIVTKSWEPPLLEFHDFLQNLRELCGALTIISIQPISADHGDVDPTDVEIWRHSIEKLQDTRAHVV